MLALFPEKAKQPTLAATRVVTGSDREKCGLLPLLSPELCLVLLGAGLEWTADTRACGQLFLSAPASASPRHDSASRGHEGQEPSGWLLGSSDRLYWRQAPLFEFWGSCSAVVYTRGARLRAP